MEEKRCTGCGKTKSLDDFGPDKRASDGKQSRCKRCCADYQHARRKDPKLKAEDRTRINQAMAKRKDHYDRLHNQARQRRRQDPAYREQERQYSRQLYTPERGRTQNHGRRARRIAAQVAGPVPASVYAAVLTSGPCVYCGAPAVEVDHVTPLHRGGHEAEYNLVPACSSCNRSKGAKLLTEWDQTRVTQALACSLKVCAQLNFQRPQLVTAPARSGLRPSRAR